MSGHVEHALIVGQEGVYEARRGVATAERALGVVDRALEISDRVLVDVDKGLVATEDAIATGRRVLPKVLIGLAVATVVTVGVVVVLRRRSRSADDSPAPSPAYRAPAQSGPDSGTDEAPVADTDDSAATAAGQSEVPPSADQDSAQ